MSRKTARQNPTTPTTTTTFSTPSGLGNGLFTGGLGAQSPILYPDSKTLYDSLTSQGVNAGSAETLAQKFGGKPILTSGYTDSAGNINKSGFLKLMDEINKAGGIPLVEAAFSKVPGLNISEYFQGTKGIASVTPGALLALNSAGSTYGGDLTKLPTDVNYGPGLSASNLQRQQVLNEALTISGQQVQAMAAAQASSSAKIGAYETLNQTLSNYDLASLSPQVYDWVFKNGITNPRELMNLVRDTAQYKQQFAGLIEQQKSAAANGVKPLTEATYMGLVNSYQQTAQAAGLPMSMLTAPGTKGRTVMQDLVAGNVSAAEFSRRVASGYQAVNGLPQQVQDAFMQQHGITKGQLAAYFLDPKNGEEAINRERQALGANLGYNAQSAGLQGFTGQQAMDLGEMVRASGLGATAQDPYNSLTLGQAQKALQTASKDVALTGSAPGGTAPTVDTQTLIGAQVAGFEGTNLQAAQTTAQRAAQAAAAPFEKGGGYAETAKGVTGVGSGAI
jgi:hypothetical protein